MNGSRFEPDTRSFWSRMCGCIPDSVSLRFIQFHEWLKFRADIGPFWSRMLRSCVPDSVSLRFEFSFMNGSSFKRRYLDRFGRMLRGCVPDSVSLRFEFSFMNGSSFELCSDHFGVAMLAARQELESQVQQAH